MENTKRDLSLDFNKPRNPRCGQPVPSLATPVLSLSTPEIKRFITDQPEELAVLTPNGISSVISQSNNILPSPLIPTTVNTNIINQNGNNLSNNDSITRQTMITCNTNNNGNNNQNNNNHHHLTNNNNISHNNSNHVHHKRSSDKSRDPDCEKIEKKRERNRLAAKKCRQRKLETIESLRKTVSEWEQKYHRLELEYEQYKRVKSNEIEQLRAKLIKN